MNGLLKLLFVGVVAFGGYDLYQKHYAKPDKPEVNWQTVHIESVNINALFPKTPKAVNQTIQGLSIDAKEVRYGSADFSLGVVQNLDFSIEDAYPHSLTSKGAKLRERTPIQVNGYEGYEFKLDVGKRQAVQRMVQYYNALVIQTVLFTEAETEEAGKFIGSLTL